MKKMDFRDRPQPVIPGFSVKVSDAAVPVVHALQPELLQLANKRHVVVNMD